MPTQQDVQRLIALREARKRGMMGPTQTAALQEIERRMSMGDQVASYAEPAMTAASAAFAEPVSGLVGLAALPFGSDVSTRAIERTQEAMTYQPRTEGGQRNLQGLMSFMAPVGEAFEGASSYLGDAAYEATGSPALGAAAYSLPAAGLELLGLRGTRQLSQSGKLGRQLEMGDIGPGGMGSKQRGIFAGVKAKTADLDALDRAKDLEAQGASRDEIWAETGWFKDVDGQWKFEIDDSRAALEGLNYEAMKQRAIQEGNYDLARELSAEGRDYTMPYEYPETQAVSDVFRSDELYGAYPEAGGIAFRGTEGAGPGEGVFSPQANLMEVGAGTNPESARSVILHELQHRVQNKEGFAGGGSPFDKTLPTIQEALGDFNAKVRRNIEEIRSSDQYRAFVDDFVSKVPESEVPVSRRTGQPSRQLLVNEAQAIADKKFGVDDAEQARKAYVERRMEEAGDSMMLRPREDAYRRLAGEAEARNVQTRRDFTPQQRRDQPPWSTLDVPESELIVRRGGGAMESAGAPPFSSSTGDVDIDKRVKSVEMMTPDEYLEQAFEATDKRLGGDYESWLESNQRTKADIQEYSEAMRSGEKFPMPWVDFNIGSQDGRNRALAAKMAGIKEIPVGVIPKKTATERIPEIMEELKTAKGMRKFRLESEMEKLAGELSSNP